MMADLTNVILIACAFAAGGVLKGAAGAGAPILAVPLLALLYDVPLAVALFVMPNVISNLIQAVQYRGALAERRFVIAFAGAGVAGAVLGTLALAAADPEVLMLGVAVVVLVYVVFRLSRPDWQLPMRLARGLVVPAGLVAGVMQGAAGISAPVSVTFLSAMQMPRATFIATVSVFFLAMGLVQLPTQVLLGIMTWERFWLGCLALIPLTACMPLGAWIGRRLSREVFDRVILGLLALLAVKMLWDALA
ncbi:putative membrane protein [Candidatus Rhodobacter oscarellae]|uniref:Probable membrane transporter protein n=1 Tax=Candidatus Rhodobacter oscarellae TaxID=1675527 RepID=A0A0J9E585_9RHOB|nr:sulfite exporter TauE/SafE family protein [Candidatus Rhodobacter lobularis]KMW57917.1 putative membrane protein [Candidatus Rhodobacter lobularis]